MKDKLTQDLKQAMLSGDKARVQTLNMLKSALLNEEVAQGARETGLDNETITAIFAKEGKKRLEAAEFYKKAGETTREVQERSEYDIISEYLPKQLSDEALQLIVEQAVVNIKPEGLKDIGKVIGAVKAQVGNQADGGRVASLVKQTLN